MHTHGGDGQFHIRVVAAKQNACPAYSRPNCFAGPFSPTPESRSVGRSLRLKKISRLIFDFKRVFACFSIVRVRPSDGAFPFLGKPDLDLALFSFVYGADILTVL